MARESGVTKGVAGLGWHLPVHRVGSTIPHCLVPVSPIGFLRVQGMNLAASLFSVAHYCNVVYMAHRMDGEGLS